MRISDERIQQCIQLILNSVTPSHTDTANALLDLKDARKEIDKLLTLARDAQAAWDGDNDARVGKLLRAMVDKDFCKSYRPDLVQPTDSESKQ